MSRDRILVVRLSALGDVLLATPAVRALAKAYPGAAIDWLVEAPYAPLLEGNPYARPVKYEKRGEHAGVRGILSLRRALAATRYDLVVDLQDKPKTRLFHFATECVAFRKRTPAQVLRSLVGAEKPLTRAHAVDLFLGALEPLGIASDGRKLDLVVTHSMYEQADRLLPTGRLAAIAPGARWATKRWPAGRFAEVISALEAKGYRPVLLGGAGDAEAFAQVRAQVGDLPDTSTLDVGGLAAAIARSALVVAGDSGPAHLASALGVPLVAIFGPTSPERWRPLSACSEVVRLPLECSPCTNHGGERCPLGHHDCMVKLGADQVLAAVERVTTSESKPQWNINQYNE